MGIFDEEECKDAVRNVDVVGALDHKQVTLAQRIQSTGKVNTYCLPEFAQHEF